MPLRECAAAREPAAGPELIDVGKAGRVEGVNTEALGSRDLPELAVPAARPVASELSMILSSAAMSDSARSASTFSTATTLVIANDTSLKAATRAALSAWYAAISFVCSSICFSISPINLSMIWAQHCWTGSNTSTH